MIVHYVSSAASYLPIPLDNYIELLSPVGHLSTKQLPVVIVVGVFVLIPVKYLPNQVARK